MKMIEGMDILPHVTIIIPAYNSEKTINQLLESLLIQSYPKLLIDIIVVDNNSKDNTREIVKKFPVKLLEENKIQSSYAARNKGIKEARGEVVAFIDSDCIASDKWIEEGIKTLYLKSADLAGGRVEFIYSNRKSAAEIYDSKTNMQIESNISERGVAKTANLFVRSFVFDKIGLFPYHAKSGGDVYWTSLATKSGLNIAYAADAIVKHPARGLKELLKKQLRVGTGLRCAMRSEEKPFIIFVYSAIKLFLHKKSSRKKNIIRAREMRDMSNRLVNIRLISFLCYACMGIGIFLSFFINSTGKPKGNKRLNY
jgi:glycosyltransferase AglE